MRTRTVLCTLALSCLAASPAGAQDKDDIAQKAKAVLTTYCYECHGKNGAIEGGVNYLLDRHQLVARKKVIPGEPGKSRIYKRVINEEMPPEDVKRRPGAEELAILKQWIVAGAPDFNPAPIKPRIFVTNQAIQQKILDDLMALPSNDRRFTRYFTITHLYNAGLSEDELETYRQAVSKLINSLSWGKAIAVPKAIDADRTILRIDLRSYKWTDRFWDLLESHYDYGLLEKTELEKRCQMAAKTHLPYLRGDWFVAHAAVPPLYHDLLQLPQNDQGLESLLHLNLRDNQKDSPALRAGFNGSGVSKNNRLIERYETFFGAYWKSYDFAGNTGVQNLFSSPLGPRKRPNAFQHAGGELVFNLPNGLQAYMLVDQSGRRIDKGPLEIVSDPRRPDRAVVNGLSCMSCHARGIIFKEDQVRPHVLQNKQAFVDDELKLILALYVPREKMNKAMDEDAARFRAAVEKTGCRLGTTEPVVALAVRYESEIDLALAAAELGMTAETLRKQFARSVTLARSVGPLAVEGGTVQRDVFTGAFAEIVRDLELGAVLPRQKKPFAAIVRPPTWTPPWEPAADTPSARPVVSQFQSLSATDDDPWSYPIRSHESGQLHAVAISPRDNWLWAAEAKVGIVSLYRVRDYSMLGSLIGHKGNVLSVDFSPDGTMVATGSIDQTARIWDAVSCAEMKTFGNHAGFVNVVKFSPDGKWMASGSERLRLWNVASGKEIASFPKAIDWVEDLGFAAEGRVIATASKAVQLWDAASGKLLDTLGDPEGSVVAIGVAPKLGLLAAGASDGTVQVWDLASKKVVKVLAGHRQAITSLAFNPNGKMLLSTAGGKRGAGTAEGEYKAWDVVTGKELTSQAGHSRGISCVAISADGRHAVTAGLDGRLRYRELMSLGMTALDPFEGHADRIKCVVLSDDGKLALTGGADRTARLWNMQTGEQLQSLQGRTLDVQFIS